jgi:hypothetical protein
MEKEFKVYKDGLGRFELVSSTELSGRHISLTFREDPKLEINDAIWSIDDKERGIRESVLVVEKIGKDGAILKRGDGGFLSEIRSYEAGELFTILATFRNVESNE